MFKLGLIGYTFSKDNTKQNTKEKGGYELNPGWNMVCIQVPSIIYLRSWRLMIKRNFVDTLESILFRIIICFLLNRIIYKMRKMLGNIHEAMCDSYFTIKCLLEWNPAGVTLLNYLMHRFCLIQCNTNLIQTSRSKNWKY